MKSLSETWTRGGLLFGKMWEDALVEMGQAQQIVEREGACKVLSIASSGDTSFALASLPGVEVQATDINPTQIWLCELKQAILREFGREALKQHLYGDCRPLFRHIRTQLALPCRSFWDAHEFLLRDGFHRAGRVDRMMNFWLWLFSKLVVSRAGISTLLNCEDPAFQRELVESQWRGWRWDLGIRVAFWRPILRAIYGRELADRLSPQFGRQMSHRLLRFLTDFEARTNPYLWQTFAQSKLGPTRAPYLNQWGPVDFIPGTVEEHVTRRPERYDLFVLSNILEVANRSQCLSLLKTVRSAASPGALVCLRFMAPRPPVWPEEIYLKHESQMAGLKDRAFFCNHFQFYKLP